MKTNTQRVGASNSEAGGSGCSRCIPFISLVDNVSLSVSSFTEGPVSAQVTRWQDDQPACSANSENTKWLLWRYKDFEMDTDKRAV